MRRGLTAIVSMSILCVALAGCGYNRGDRAASGGLIGAGGGAAIAAVTGGSPLVGAAIGAGAGALGGALTSGRDMNLGRPVWR
jgi:osmotically inducible lipoprotein OsmB